MADKKISQLTEITTPDDTDVQPVVDTSATETKKITWANIKATLKTYFDAIYAAISHTHTASDITDFNTAVSNNTDVSANTADRHAQNTDTGTSAAEFYVDTGGANVAVKGHIQDTSNPHSVTAAQAGAIPSSSAPTGDIVGTTDTQTLTNKILTSSTNTIVTYTLENAQTGTAYTLVLSDAGKVVTMNNASANTLTVPANSSVAFPVGTKIMVTQLGAGSTTIAADTGVTINNPASASLEINEQYGSRVLWKEATDTWLLV